MNKLLKEWMVAKDDLGFEIVAPFKVNVGNVKILADILVRDFGGENGTLIFTNTYLFWPYRDQLSKLGYGYSVLEEPSDNACYNREDFIELLSEWGWTGSQTSKPEWIAEPED